MHEMQTIVTDVRGVCQSVCDAGSLPNHFGILLHELCIFDIIKAVVYNGSYCYRCSCSITFHNDLFPYQFD